MQFESNQRITNPIELVFYFFSCLFHLVENLLPSQLNLEATLLLLLRWVRELAPSLWSLCRFLNDELIVEVISSESICREVILIEQIFFYLTKVLGEVAEIIGLECICLEIYCLVIHSCRLSVIICERIKVFLRSLWNLWLSNHWFCLRLWKRVKVKISKLIGFIISLGGCCKAAKFRERISLFFLVLAFLLWLFFITPTCFFEDVVKVPVVDSEFELIDIVWSSSDSEDMSLDFVHEIEVYIEEAA